MKFRKIFHRNEDGEHNFWMSYTDLMSGFLVVFIIISAITYNNLNKEKEEYQRLCDYLKVENPDSLKNYIHSLEEIVDSINNSKLQNRINDYKEIFTSTPEIKVSFNPIRGSISLTHQNPNSDLFTQGEYSIKSPLKEYLDERYVDIVNKTIEINDDKHNVELRIEGHTDPRWGYERGSEYSFLENLSLSSNRANAVYEYILKGPKLSDSQKQFVMKNMISVGYSFSDRVQKDDIIDEKFDPSSRRIEFRIISK